MPKIPQSQVKQAYQIVTQDLTEKLKSIKHGQKVRINNLGTFAKSQSEIKAWDGKTYIYWKINFRASNNLKEELENGVEFE